MANADKKGMAVWPVASGESVRRGRFYRCPKRKVLSFPLRDERVDKMEVSRVCYIPSVLQGAGSLGKGRKVLMGLFFVKQR